MKKVKRISIDVLVEETVNETKLTEKIAESLEEHNFVILSSVFHSDVTEIYKNDKMVIEETGDMEELCPHCDYVNGYNWDGIARKMICKGCGEEILLCSLCDMDKVECSKCPY